MMLSIQECFNYRHSSLRMKVECAFGQIKKRWKLLYNMPQISKKYQMSIIVSVFTLHNFIRMHQLGIPILQHEATEGIADFGMFDHSRKVAMRVVRDSIAQQIWQANQGNIERDDVENENNNNIDDMEID